MVNIIQGLKAFMEMHSKWFSSFDRIEPVYCLPTAVIDTLRRRTISRRSESFISDKEAIAERAFTQLCDENQALGFWNGAGISCTLLKPPPNPLSCNSTSIPWVNNAANVAELNSLTDRLSSTRERVKGIAGWLMTDQAFLTQLAQLKKEYEAIDIKERPGFPLMRSVLLHASETGSEAARQFHSSFQGFCNRYGLMQLVTWDLPEPQGPYFSDPLPANSPVRPERGLYLFIPLSYPVTGSDDLLSMIFSKQQELARSLNVDERLARLTSHVIFSKALEIDFLERAIRSRFKVEPHGLVSAIQEAVSRAMKLQESYVKELRTEIAARKVGRLDRLRLLK